MRATSFIPVWIPVVIKIHTCVVPICSSCPPPVGIDFICKILFCKYTSLRFRLFSIILDHSGYVIAISKVITVRGNAGYEVDRREGHKSARLPLTGVETYLESILASSPSTPIIA
jgi:hypothetical protein